MRCIGQDHKSERVDGGIGKEYVQPAALLPVDQDSMRVLRVSDDAENLQVPILLNSLILSLNGIFFFRKPTWMMMYRQSQNLLARSRVRKKWGSNLTVSQKTQQNTLLVALHETLFFYTPHCDRLLVMSRDASHVT